MNLREFLETLRVKKQELSQAGVVIEEKDYLLVILSSLPFALSNFASNILASSQVSSNQITPDDLLSMLMEESDRQRAQRSRGKGSRRVKDEENKALVVGQTGQLAKGRKEKGKNKHADLTCYNCNEMGNISCFCKKLKKSKPKDNFGKEKQGKVTRGGSGTANTAESLKEVEEDGAWAVVEGLDWFDDAIKDMESGGWANIVEEFNDVSGLAFVTEIAGPDGIAELYDSGYTNHISPYCKRFEDFTTIIPRLFRAANKQTFSTIGRGDLIVNVPNGMDFTQLRLKGVLYSPNIKYTLVSISWFDEEGFSALFGQGKCLLRGPDSEKVGEVLRTSGRVYKVEHELGTANVVVDTLTLGLRLSREEGRGTGTPTLTTRLV
jgi:hypothetical protein